jgi:hypothetical protein
MLENANEHFKDDIERLINKAVKFPKKKNNN